jgi:ElaB/YqjD/DUF883 family membrane-anchored ribosome-binding protein
MKHFAIDDHWDAIEAQLKERFDQLADIDFTHMRGDAEQLLAFLRERLDLSAEELDTLLEELKANTYSRIRQAKAKATALAGDVRAKVGSALDEAKAKGSAAADEVRAQAGAAYNEARERARTLREEGEEYARQNPREVMVAALCAGFVAGLLIRR